MPDIIVKAALLVPVFLLGLTGGALFGHVYHGLRFGRSRRRRMGGSTLQPFAVAGAVLSVVGVAIYWQFTGR